MSDSAAPQAATDYDVLIVDMRAAAAILERCNTAYDYGRLTGSWSPSLLRYEADYLERHADA